jgi:two-component system sensor histidine kinase CpxA
MQITHRVKKFFASISVKLFLTFWLVILTSVLISYLITMHFKQATTQLPANPEHLVLLKTYQQKFAEKNRIKPKVIQKQFFKQHQKHLLIKKISNSKVYSPKSRSWSSIKKYVKRHTLTNPVTVDFDFTQVTSSSPIMVNGEMIQLLVANPLARKRLLILVDRFPFNIRLLFLLLLSFLCCWLLAKSFTKPLIAIQKASSALGEGKLNTRISTFDKRTDELGDLARSFNTMAAQLENNINSHQRLLGDVSHELRSPLTRLQLAIALTEKSMGKDDEQKKHLSRCENEIDRLDEMISEVLTLSRLEHGKQHFSTEPIDLNNVLQLLILDYQYLANNRNITISLLSEQNCMISGNHKLLMSAIGNILSNAVKYSPNDKTIKVELKKKPSHFELSVVDQGIGVPDEMLDKLFMPFFRVAEGRERASGGTGLGLAIAKQAISFHQGDIYAQNIEKSGLSITIVLPQLST